VLAEVGRLLGRQLRKVDLIARWGGEEFVAALSGTAQQDGLMVAERLRARLESLTVRATDGTPIAVTASFGVAQWDGNEKADAVIDRADRAMYTAKHNGRNRVDVLAAPLSPAQTVSA
jgi:diguanylate cyclase (GGDEF)-like protein